MSIGNIAIQFIGFLLQVLPIAVLCIVPFSDDSLRLPRKKIILIFFCGTVAFSIGYAILSNIIFLPDGSNNTLIQPISNLYMMVCIVLWAAAFFMLTSFSAVGKMIVLMLMIYYAVVQFILNNYLVAFFVKKRGTAYAAGEDAYIVYGIETVLVSVILLAVTIIPIYMFLKRDVRFALKYMDSHILKRSCICISASLLLFFACVFCLSTFSNELYYDYTDFYVLIFLLSFIITDGILFYMLFSEVRLNTEKDLLEEQLRNFDNKYQQISDNIEKARRDRHDIRHHLNMISTLHHQGLREELDKYLHSYEASFAELELRPLCGYPAFDNIIRYYMEYAESHGIKVETEMHAIKDGLSFDVIDLTVLLGNLMENAIESCLKLSPDSPRTIVISAKQSDASFLLKIENSCAASNDDNPEFTDGRALVSTKHSIGHGQGIKSIQYVAEKYGGSAEFKKTSGIFTARIVMNIS